MGKKKKPKPRKTFIEGMDSYCDEYKYWKKRTDIIKRLVGIFEVSEEVFGLELKKLVVAVGLDGYQPLFYNAEHDNTIRSDGPISGTGCAVALRNVYGNVVPAVFVREGVASVGEADEQPGETHPQFADSIRLLVLFHELGHADDISKGLNYDHDKLIIDLAAAEAYAHDFVCRQCMKNSYPLLMSQYLENVERMAKSTVDAERVGAERFLQSGDSDRFREWLKERQSKEGFERFLRQSGRVDEIQRRNS